MGKWKVRRFGCPPEVGWLGADVEIRLGSDSQACVLGPHDGAGCGLSLWGIKSMSIVERLPCARCFAGRGGECKSGARGPCYLVVTSL